MNFRITSQGQSISTQGPKRRGVAARALAAGKSTVRGGRTVAAILLGGVALPAAQATPVVQFTVSAPGVKVSELQGTPGSSTENFTGVGSSGIGLSRPLPTSGIFANGSFTHTSQAWPAYPNYLNEVATPPSGTRFDQSGNLLVLTAGSSLTLNLTNPARYLGFYWGGGDTDNRIDLYDNTTLLATFSSADLFAMLNSSYQDPGFYNEYFAYVNLTLVDPSISFTSVVFRQVITPSLYAFEIQNLTTSFERSAVPLPSSLALLTLGLVALRARRPQSA